MIPARMLLKVTQLHIMDFCLILRVQLHILAATLSSHPYQAEGRRDYACLWLVRHRRSTVSSPSAVNIVNVYPHTLGTRSLV